MEAQFDLFEMRAGACPRWISRAADLQSARKRLEDLAQAKMGVEYFVRDFCSGSVVAFAVRAGERELDSTKHRTPLSAA